MRIDKTEKAKKIAIKAVLEADMRTLETALIVRKVATSPKTLDRARTDPAYFTRERSMPFRDLILFLLNPAKECLQIRLNNFFKLIGKRELRMTQQALSKARSRFDHSPFEEMTRELVKKEYGGGYALSAWNGYSVFGIDGSIGVLPNTSTLREEFGVSGVGGTCASAGMSILYDILHDWIVDASIGAFPQDERASAKAHIDFLQTELAHLEKKLLLLDRGYPSLDLLAYMQAKGLRFLCRCQKSWVKEVESAPPGDSIHELSNGQIVRVFKFYLPGGEPETLLTNLFEVPPSELPKLYFLRWGIEGKYDVLKNKLQIENFSGYTKNTILQDFWASITLSILVAVAKKEANEKLQSRIGDKPNFREQQPNVSQLVGSLKDEFILICRYESNFVRNFAIDRMIDQISRAVTTIRPDKPKHPRITQRKKKQYPINRKSNI